VGISFSFCQKLKIWTLRQGPTRTTVPNLIKIGQKVADIWWFNGFQNGSLVGFLKFNFLTVCEVKRPMLHQRTKFRKDRSNRCGDNAILWFLRCRPQPCWIFKKSNFLRTILCRGPIRVTVPNFIKIGHAVAEIWRFNGFQNGGRPPSWIFEIRIFFYGRGG